MKERTARFLIIAGAITAFGLPVTLAFPPSFLLKVGATAALVALACGIAALAMKPKKNP
ncbi:MAG TPA: hypothetical protein VNH12_11600 [Burkholderiales bacterium]|nr:hypothetical protein [Burkholderiales bacterium]